MTEQDEDGGFMLTMIKLSQEQRTIATQIRIRPKYIQIYPHYRGRTLMLQQRAGSAVDHVFDLGSHRSQ